MHPARLVLSALIFCCSGCAVMRISSLTESAPVNIPTHTGRNQLSGQLGYGGKRGYDGSLSYAVTNHVALGGTVFMNQQTFHDNPLPGLSDGYSVAINSTYWEGQVSYYRTMRQAFTWAATGGYGSGSRQLRWIENQLDARYSRYFMQASGSWTGPSNWQWGAAIKLHYTDYVSASIREQSALTKPVPTGSPGGLLGIDVAQMIRLPLLPVLSFNGQFGCYIPLGGVTLPSRLGFQTYNNLGLIATVGLTLSLPEKK